LDVNYGNLLHQSVDDVWKAMAVWRDGAYIPTICRQCGSLAVCGGGCRMEAKAYTGKLDALDPYAQPARAAGVLVRVRARMDADIKARTAAIRARGADYLRHSFNRFKLNGLRMREESFGGAVMLDNGSWVLADSQEYAVLKQLQHAVTYGIDKNHIDWQGRDPQEMVRRLVGKHLAVFVEDSFRYELM
jgi:hypothetical protein